MSKIEAIVHLYISGYMSIDKAYKLAKNRGITQKEIDDAISEAEKALYPEENDEGELNE